MCAESIRVMCPLFHEGEGGSTPTSALQLHVTVVPLDLARGLNREWHSRFPKIDQRVAANLCFAADFEGVYYAAAIWGCPIARALPQNTWLELRRLAIAPDAPKNTASRLLAVMSRLVRTERPLIERLVSYQDMEAHTGCIYKAAGWTATRVHDGHGFDKSNRGRPKPQSIAPKQRWEKAL